MLLAAAKASMQSRMPGLSSSMASSRACVSSNGEMGSNFNRGALRAALTEGVRPSQQAHMKVTQRARYKRLLGPSY